MEGAELRIDRAVEALRPVSIELDYLPHAEGSAMIDAGRTRVLCAVSVEERVPGFLEGRDEGWVTAEYSMLPRATSTRSQREVSRGRPSGRTMEIQRLIGRALRAVVDRKLLGPRTLQVDCDVIVADGGTRAASITGAAVAVSQACRRLLDAGRIGSFPLNALVASVSVGRIGDVSLLDLEYSEDSRCDVDLNVVRTSQGRYVEIQGTAEGQTFGDDHLQELLGLAAGGIDELLTVQRRALGDLLPESLRGG